MATVKLDPAKGVQIPNMTTTERNAISSPETGALVWNTTTSAVNQYNGSAWGTVGISEDATKLPLAGGTITGHVDFNDNVFARFGTGNDLQIHHNGTHSYINNTGTGDLQIRGNDVKIVGTTSSENMAHFVEDGAVDLYHNNVKKFETTATGVTITGSSVGIGNASPSSFDSGARQLVIGDAGTASTGMTLAASTNNIIYFADGTSGDAAYRGSITYNHPSDYMNFRTGGFTERMRIDSNGKVGIGTTSPSQPLEVRKDQNSDTVIQVWNNTAGTGAAAALRVKSNSALGLITVQDDGYTSSGIYQANTFSIFAASVTTGGLLLGTESGHPIKFYANNSEKMQLNSSGKLLIGTTSTATINDGGVSINAGGASGSSYGGYAMKVNHGVGTGDGAGIMINIPNYDGSAGQTMLKFYTASGSPGSIKSTQSSTAYNTSSDYRLKENVNYTWDATTKLKQLKPAEFNFKVTPSKTVEGFLAHEVSDIIPAAIAGEKDATETLTNVVLKASGVCFVDGITEAEWEQGKIDNEYPSDSTWVASHTQDVNQEIDQSKLVPLLVKTIQELEARITTLESA